jgi:hypothetical protein
MPGTNPAQSRTLVLEVSSIHPAPKGAIMTDSHSAPTTTNAGIPVESDEHSLTIGADGPIRSSRWAG